ncbi:MAG: LacI family DNA-binding transcriptional regulator [Fibrobacterota bacterium]
MQEIQRLHIAVILSSLEEVCQQTIWQGIKNYTDEQKIKTTVLSGATQEEVELFKNYYDIIFDFAKNSTVFDSYVIFGASIANEVSVDTAQEYCRAIQNKPRISLNFSCDNISSIEVDNTSGIRHIVKHLHTAHHKEKIAFVKGNDNNPEALSRLDAYISALEELNLEIHPDRIIPGRFTKQSGHRAVKKLLSENIAFDALVCVDDITALGAMKELYYQGYSVPGDIAVTGFDNITQAAIHSPTLTTVSQPFVEIGLLAAKHLHMLYHRQEKIRTYTIPCRMKIGQSCGCVPRRSQTSAPSTFHSVDEPFRPDTLFADIDIDAYTINEWIETLTTSMHADTPDLFLDKLNTVLIEYDQISDDYTPWYTFFRSFFVHEQMSRHNESIYRAAFDAVELIKDMELHATRRKLEYQNIEQRQIRSIIHKILTSHGKDDFFHKLEKSFIELTVKQAVIAVYPTPVSYLNSWRTPPHIRLLWKFDNQEGIRLNAEARVQTTLFFEESDTFFSEDILHRLFLPLYYNKKQLGVLMIDYNEEYHFNVYETLRIALSTGLYNHGILTPEDHS